MHYITPTSLFYTTMYTVTIHNTEHYTNTQMMLSQVNQSITMVDNTLGLLLDGLKERNISDCVNLIITSDHGEVAMMLVM